MSTFYNKSNPKPNPTSSLFALSHSSANTCSLLNGIQQYSQLLHGLLKHIPHRNSATKTNHNPSQPEIKPNSLSPTQPPKDQLLCLFQCLIMENFRPPFTSSTTTTSSSSSSSFSTLDSSSSLSYYYPAVQNLPPPPNPYWPYPPSMCPSAVKSANAARAATEEKRMARQRRILILRRRNAARAVAASSKMAGKRVTSVSGSDTQNNEQDLYSFCTPDNKKLRLLFRKELKNSDVGSLGRIVLPKKEAEKYLPSLSDKEGIELMIKDAFSNQEWGLKYKYWTNNNSRMYVFENTGDFVRQSRVEVGDSIHLYEDESTNLYISYPSERFHQDQYMLPAPPCTYQQRNYTITKDDAGNSSGSHAIAANTAVSNYTKTTNEDNLIDQEKNANPNTYVNNNNKTHAEATSTYTYNEARTEEDESSSAVLLQQQHKELLIETNNMVTLFTDHASSYRQSEEASTNSNNDVTRQFQTSSTQPVMAGILGASSSASSSRSIVKMVEDDFDDCYKGLGTLPEVDRFEHCLLDCNFIIKDDKT